MEIAKTKMTAVEETVKESALSDLRELNELHLALVGGGIGDVIVA